VAYTMVAKRDDQKVSKLRNSALIVMASARIWESEGWDITVTDADGKEFDLAGFEETLAQPSSWLSPRPVPAPEVQPADHLESNDEPAELKVEPTVAEAEHSEVEAEHSDEEVEYSDEEVEYAEAEASDEELEFTEEDVEQSEWTVEPA
jgi:hypothetical protein